MPLMQSMVTALTLVWAVTEFSPEHTKRFVLSKWEKKSGQRNPAGTGLPSCCPVFSAVWSVSLQFHLVGALGTRFGNRRHNAAKAETTGYARAFRRACDSQQRCRLR